ncbi:hypothetical protein MASR2M15_07860 [Anaerolineales bacterium]
MNESGGLSFIVLLVAFVVTVLAISNNSRRKKRVLFRTMDSVERLPIIISSAMESGSPMHLGMSRVTIGTDTTLLTLAGAEWFYQTVKQLAIADPSPIISVSETATLPVAMDTLRRAYLARNRISEYRAFRTRWIPSGDKNLTYAAALSAMTRDDDLGGHLLMGRWGHELALVMDTAHQHRIPVLATSTRLEGQAVAYAMAPDTLIGEEIFGINAYLSDQKQFDGVNLATDTLRWIVVIIMVILFILIGVRGGG